MAQTQDTLLPVRRYPIANARIKLSFREVGFNLTPFVKWLPWLSIGAGYRFHSNLVKKMECVFGEPALLKGSLKGPFITAGFDSKNWRTFHSMNYSVLVGYKRLDAGRVDYVEKGCVGGGGSWSAYKLYDATANEMFFKCLLDFQRRKKQWASLYAGFGGAFRQVRKAYVERGTLETYYADDDVEKVLYFIPLCDMGLRINFIGLKARN